MDDALPGAPAVRERFWSKSLNELVMVRKVQMVNEGMTSGMVMAHLKMIFAGS